MSWEKFTFHNKFGGMGFKDPASLNVAVLGKEVWKLQTNAYSLVSRLFKTRYFPNSNFFGAKIVTSLGYVWRNILSVKDVVKRGARWSIDTGNSIPLMDQPWLASGVVFRSHTQVTQNFTMFVLVNQNVRHQNRGNNLLFTICMTRMYTSIKYATRDEYC